MIACGFLRLLVPQRESIAMTTGLWLPPSNGGKIAPRACHRSHSVVFLKGRKMDNVHWGSLK